MAERLRAWRPEPELALPVPGAGCQGREAPPVRVAQRVQWARRLAEALPSRRPEPEPALPFLHIQCTRVLDDDASGAVDWFLRLFSPQNSTNN
jgi:hypothetical protein